MFRLLASIDVLICAPHGFPNLLKFVIAWFFQILTELLPTAVIDHEWTFSFLS
jgi:hypothetical protein